MGEQDPDFIIVKEMSPGADDIVLERRFVYAPQSPSLGWLSMTDPWLMRQARKEADRDAMRLSDVIGQLIGALIALAVALYFVALYNLDTGFFTTQFTNADAALFFGIAFLGIVPGLAKIPLKSKNAARPLEVILQALVLIAALVFLSAFPFDFAHLADALPSGLQPIVSWVTNDMARLVLGLVIVASLFLIPWTVIQHVTVKKVMDEKKNVSGGPVGTN
jgi:hypothetical protein